MYVMSIYGVHGLQTVGDGKKVARQLKLSPFSGSRPLLAPGTTDSVCQRVIDESESERVKTLLSDLKNNLLNECQASTNYFE